VWVFEMTSALLITAAWAPWCWRTASGSAAAHQREWPSALPRGRAPARPAGPGVYARHNAVDTPALLPDGTPSELSVSRVLTARDQNVARRLRGAERPIERDVEEGATR
jgi:NADH-quinone oxidoreductase subunit J